MNDVRRPTELRLTPYSQQAVYRDNGKCGMMAHESSKSDGQETTKPTFFCPKENALLNVVLSTGLTDSRIGGFIVDSRDGHIIVVSYGNDPKKVCDALNRVYAGQR